jgi:hypothetical protein
MISIEHDLGNLVISVDEARHSVLLDRYLSSRLYY